jgi:uncharacterized membrane protein YczE
MDNRGKRVLMSVLGVVICGVSVGMLKHAALGVDPFQCLMSGLNAVIPIHFGTLYWIVNLVLLSVSLLLDRTKIGLATFINLFLLGYIAEFSQGMMGRVFPMPGFALRVGILAFAIVSVCLSSAFYFTAALGVSTYDAVALIWSERQTKIPFSRCRIITDFACVLIGVLLCRLAGYTLGEIFGVLGIGTIITAFFMGPLIAFFNKTVAEPFLRGGN